MEGQRTKDALLFVVALCLVLIVVKLCDILKSRRSKSQHYTELRVGDLAKQAVEASDERKDRSSICFHRLAFGKLLSRVLRRRGPSPSCGY
jgi:hypothetical protein